MQTSVETVNSYLKKLTVEISPEELAPIEKKQLRQYQRKADIPGFRRGHAPLTIIRKQYGSLIQQDIIEEVLRQYYSKALEETDLDPVSQGKITDLKFEDAASGMTFVIEVEVAPEFELKKYKGLKVEKEVVEVTDEMVEEALQNMREQYATVKEVEEAAEGHFLHFEVQELDSGNMPVIGHKYENLQVQLGSGKFDPEIEKQLIGIKKGEKRIVRSETPPPPGSESSEPIVTALEVHALKIEEKEFPELNDDFVKNLNDEHLDTLEQLRERLRQNMELDLRNRVEQTFKNRLIDELLKENPFDVPPGMVDSYLDGLIEDFKKQAQGQPIDEEAIRKQYRVNGIHNIRWHFLKKKIVEAENLTVSEEEIREYLDKMNLEEKMKELFLSDERYQGQLKEDLLENKVLDLLKENAEVVEVFPAAAAAAQAAESQTQEEEAGQATE